MPRFTPENFLAGSLNSKEQPQRRLSQVWTYYAQRNPLEGQTDPDNYRSTEALVELQAETDYGTPAIKRIFSRWIPPGGRSVASRLNDIQIGRFRDPPRRFTFATLRGTATVDLGAGYRIEAWPLQDDTGATIDVPIQVTRLNPKVDVIEAEAQEMLFQAFEVDPTDRTIIIDFNQNNLNLRTIHDTLFTKPESGDNVLCIVEAGVVVGSTSTTTPAFDVGDWPAGVSITLNIAGRLQGRGGDGGAGGFLTSVPAEDGAAGGVALKVGVTIDLEVPSGEIFGGGGGGGGSLSGDGGGGGAGTLGGIGGSELVSGATAGDPGTPDAGGAGGGTAGTGGGPGLAGQVGGIGGGAGGAAGAAIDGVSFVTVTAGPGDIRGPQIN